MEEARLPGRLTGFGPTGALQKDDGDIGKMNGYAGKILRLDLTNRKTTTIPTSDYAQWGGGHGIGSAVFFDLVKDKTIDGFDPANVVTLMTSPLCGTIVPAAGGRTEVQGIGVQSYPIGWFTRSNFGGRFSSQLKYAGWDGIVVEGRADKPVWIDIRDGEVRIRDLRTWDWTTSRTNWKRRGSWARERPRAVSSMSALTVFGFRAVIPVTARSPGDNANYE